VGVGAISGGHDKLEDRVAAIISLEETVERMSARTENGTARDS
jgi:hypothetical protein